MTALVKLDDLVWELDKRGVKMTTDGRQLWIEVPSAPAGTDPHQYVADLHDEMNKYLAALIDITMQRS